MASPNTPLLKANSIWLPVGALCTDLLGVAAGFVFPVLQVKHFL